MVSRYQLGKSTFLKWLQGLLGIQNASALDSGVEVHIES